MKWLWPFQFQQCIVYTVCTSIVIDKLVSIWTYTYIYDRGCGSGARGACANVYCMVYVTMMMAKVVTSVRMDGQGLKPSLLYFWNCSTNQRMYLSNNAQIHRRNIYMMGYIELSHFGICRLHSLSLSLRLQMFIIIAFYFCFLNHTKRFDIGAKATTIEANITEEPTAKKFESENGERKNRRKTVEWEKNVCEFRNQLSSAFGACVCAEKFYGDACLSAKAKRVKVLCITLMRLCMSVSSSLLCFLFFSTFSHSVF